MLAMNLITSGALRRLLAGLLMALGALGPAGLGHAAVGDGDLERFGAIAQAYRDGRGWQFSQMLQHELRSVRDLDAQTCVSRQIALVQTGKRRGFDGLESLALAHHDCMASSEDPDVTRKAQAVLDDLAHSLWFSNPPIPNLPQRLARHGTLVERGVEGAAVRAVLSALTDESVEVASMSLNSVLALPSVERALCKLPLRPGSDGRATSGASLARLAMCEGLGRPGGPGAMRDLCAPGEKGDSAYERIGTADALAISSETSDEDARNAAKLAASTCMAGAGDTGVGALPAIDPLDPFSIEECIGGDAFDQAGAADVAQLVQDCFGGSDDTGSWDPAASDGDDGPAQPESDAEPDTATEEDDSSETEPEGETSETGSDESGSEANGETGKDDGTSEVVTAIGNTAGTVGDAASAIEIQMVLMEAAAGEFGAGAVIEAAGIVGIAVTVATIAVEVYDTLSDLSKYTRENPNCWPNCQEQGDPEVGSGGFDPENESCQALVDLGVVPPGAKIEESDIAPIAIAQPSPEDGGADAGNGAFCGDSTGLAIDGSVQCRMDKDCGHLATLMPDCSCRPRSDAAAVWLAESAACSVMVDCTDGVVVNEAGFCFCDQSDDAEIDDRWGRPDGPDPVGGTDILRR